MHGNKSRSLTTVRWDKSWPFCFARRGSDRSSERKRVISPILWAGLIFSTCLVAAEFKGAVTDPSGAPIAGAQVSITIPVGIAASTSTAAGGGFDLALPDAMAAEARLVVTAPGFRTEEIALASVSNPESVSIRLEIAPRIDSVRVAGSALDVSLTESGSSAGVVPREEIRQSNLPLAVDLLRTVPGLVVSQTGFLGGVAGLYIRGGYPDFNLVEIDGVPVNAFGGNFDFAHIPAEALDRVEVTRGSQSAVYGPYANSGVINFVTRQPDQGPNLDVLAEGGTYRERRFGAGGGARVAGFGFAASASRLDDDGPVANSDYHNRNLVLSVIRRFGRHSIAFHGNVDSNNVGEPGPWGSDPAHTFTGIDLVSRSRNNFSDYAAHYQIDISPRAREEILGSFFLNNNGYTSAYGFSFNKDLRGQAESRTIVNVTRWYTAAFGAAGALEEIRNTYITDASFSAFPIRRNDTAVYLENRLVFGGRLFVNLGARGEFIRTGAIPADGYTRPYFPAQTIGTANPKVAAAYVRGRTRLHTSFGTGVRPPAGFDLAFTDNPTLQPERTRSFDGGVERQLLHDSLLLDATYFYNRFYDLIVILGGSLSRLSRYHSDNIANSRAQGAEFSAQFRPAAWLFVSGWYTWLRSDILSLNGAGSAAPAPFSAGQELLRRPADSGAVSAAFTRRRLAAGASAYFRGSVLDVEPSFGASAGLFRNPGYANLTLNLNYSLGRGVTAYGILRNALDRHYEEVFGYPSPRLNFAAGLKWSFSRAQ
jgi:outer membrane receptor protein involved in Fe transport